MKWRLGLQLLHYCFIKLLSIRGMFVVLLVQGRGELAVMPAVTAVLLHQCAMDTGAEANVVSTR